MPEALDLITWLRERCRSYAFDVGGIFNRPGTGSWPIQAESVEDLEALLIQREHLLPLPKESAALANVLEVLIVDFVLEAAAEVPGLEWQRGRERGYPDIEMHGPALGDKFWAVDVKVARRKPLLRGGVSRNTNSGSPSTRATRTSSIQIFLGLGPSGPSTTTPDTSTFCCFTPSTWRPEVERRILS